MTSSLIEGIITWINDFPSKDGATNLMILSTVAPVKANPDYNKK